MSSKKYEASILLCKIFFVFSFRIMFTSLFLQIFYCLKGSFLHFMLCFYKIRNSNRASSYCFYILFLVHVLWIKNGFSAAVFFATFSPYREVIYKVNLRKRFALFFCAAVFGVFCTALTFCWCWTFSFGKCTQRKK